MNKLKLNKTIGILDWLILFSIILMFIMVYIPQSIWKEENKFKDERRFKMKVIHQAEEFYKELTGEYTTDYNDISMNFNRALYNLV